MITVVTNEEILKSLNNYLKGIYMGIDAFEKFLLKAQSINSKKKLLNIYTTYRNHSYILINRILELNGTPKNGVGFVGTLAEIVEDIKNFNIKDDKILLMKAYTAFSFGITMSDRFLRDNDLDQKSRIIIENILKEQNKLLKTLK